MGRERRSRRGIGRSAGRRGPGTDGEAREPRPAGCRRIRGSSHASTGVGGASTNPWRGRPGRRRGTPEGPRPTPPGRRSTRECRGFGRPTGRRHQRVGRPPRPESSGIPEIPAAKRHASEATAPNGPRRRPIPVLRSDRCSLTYAPPRCEVRRNGGWRMAKGRRNGSGTNGTWPASHLGSRSLTLAIRHPPYTPSLKPRLTPSDDPGMTPQAPAGLGRVARVAVDRSTSHPPRADRSQGGVW
jgi:hypothetical protein